MDKTQFIISIVTNIVAAIIIWTAVRLSRGAMNLFTKGTIQAKIRKILSTNAIPILIDSLSILFNLGILINTLIRQPSYTRLEVLTPIIASAAIGFWIGRLVSDIQKERYRRVLAAFDVRHGQLREDIDGLREQADDLRQIVGRILRQRKPRPRKESDDQKDLFS